MLHRHREWKYIIKLLKAYFDKYTYNSLTLKQSYAISFYLNKYKHTLSYVVNTEYAKKTVFNRYQTQSRPVDSKYAN